MILLRYVHRQISWTIAAITGTIVSLFFVLTLLENLGRQTLDGLLGSVRDTMLKMPEIVYLSLPACCAIGAAVGLTTLDARREIAFMRSAGLSGAKLVQWVLVAGLFWATLHAAVGELLLERSAVISHNLENQSNKTFITADRRVWIKTKEGFASIGLITPTGEQLQEVRLFNTGARGLEQVVRADQAVHDGSGWLLSDVDAASLDDQGEWGFAAWPKRRWDSGPTPELMAAFNIDLQLLSVRQLLALSRSFGELGQNTTGIDLIIYSRVADSLAIFVLMLCSLLLVRNRTTVKPGAARTAGAIALVAMLAYYYAAVIIRQFTIDEDWPALLGAALPPLLATLPLLAQFVIRRSRA